MIRRALIVCALATAACGPSITTIRLGGPYLALPKDCQVKFENVGYNEARTKWNLIGVIALPSAGADFDEKTKEVIRERACGLGGEAASLTASFNQMNQFLVLRALDPVPYAPATPGTPGGPGDPNAPPPPPQR